MPARHYRPLQMHRIPYTDLTESSVLRSLRACEAGPLGKSPFSNALAGQSLRIVTDGEGPTLDYTFRNGRELELSENGAPPAKAGYGVLEKRTVLLVSHMLPGTPRGYTLVLDRKTRLVTVFEVFFNGYAAREIDDARAAKREPQFRNGHRNREVQRRIWLGYLDGEGAPPQARHTPTNRMEGKGIYWKQDGDIEILEFYLSILYSNIIELTRFGGEMTVCAPSDYLMLSDHQFVYSRVECEFSGVFTLELIDLFDMSQNGVRLGFDERDVLEYSMYRGEGELTGQIATFEAFGNNSESRGPGRIVYRPLETFAVMTDAQVREQVLHHAHAFGDGKGSDDSDMGGYKSETVTHFAGRNLSVHMDDGPVIEYEFVDGRQLKWRYAGDAHWREAWYEMYEPDDELYFFAHFLDAEFPRSCAMVVLDLKNGLSTLVKGTTGTPFRNNETHPDFYFGVFRMPGAPIPPTYLRHAWTDEMVGETVTWNYQRGNPGLTSMHFYATPSAYSWVIFQPDGAGGPQWSSPGWYSKVRDGVYLMAWVEEACNGTLGVILFNKRTMHDAGFNFHVGPEGLIINVIGARARHAGRFEIGKYLGVKS